MAENPDLVGIYCNNDTMALAAVDAAKEIGRLDTVAIIGSDGTRAAYRSIEQGELKGTVDIFPTLIGFIGLEVAQRVADGQAVPRVVETPQTLVTEANVLTYDVPNDALLSILSKEKRP
jgi:ribose transport system substrate-binding protein